MMKIALVTAPEKPEFAFVNNFVANLLYKSETKIPPINLLYLASYLERANHVVKIFNITVFKYPIKHLLKDLKEFNPQLVGFSVVSSSFLDSLSIIKKVKDLLRIPVVIGGPHVNVYQEQSILAKSIDFGVFGEGEHTIVELADSLDTGGNLSAINGLIFKKNGNIIKNEKREEFKDLDSLLFPAYHLIDFNQYKSERFGNAHFSSMFISRGCPFSCNFCFKNTRTFRLRSVDNVIEELLFLYKKYKINKIHFWDSTFTVNKKWMKEFAEKVQRLPFKLEYTCSTRVDKVDVDIIKYLKDSGCFQVILGIESYDPSCLDTMNKRTSPKMIQEAINLAKSYDIRIYCMFIFGFPGETKKTLATSINFILNNFLELIQIRPLVLLPGTKFYLDHLKNGGRDFWDDINHGRRVLIDDLPVNSNFSKKQIDNKIRKTLLRYYLKPTNIYNLYMKKLGKFDLSMYMKGFISILSMFLQLLI